MEKDRNFCFWRVLAVGLFVSALAAVTIPGRNVSAFSSSDCKSAAKNKFKVNDNTPKPYSDITKVAPGGSDYGVNWACADSGTRAVVWLASDADGFTSLGSGKYRVNVNNLFPRTGTVTASIVSSVRHQVNKTVYATKVRLCSTKSAANNNTTSKCWGSVGITKGSGWSSDCENSSHYECFIRSKESSLSDSEYHWSNPRKVTVKIDMDKFVSSFSVHKSYSTYDQYILYMHRKYGFNNGGEGVSPVYVNVMKALPSTYTGAVTAKASSGDASVTSTTDNPGDEQTLTVSGDTYSINFKHTITRTDSNGHSAGNPWTVTVSNSGVVTGNATTSNANGTQATTTKTTYTPRDKTYSGTIFAGQTITYCEEFKFATYIKSGETTQYDTKKVCIKVKKASSTCSDLEGDLANSIYSFSNGQNLGQIGVLNTTLGNNYKFVSSGVDSIYARPGDDIRFRYNYCAGGVYARVTGGGETVSNISFRPSADSDGAVNAQLKGNYLFSNDVSTYSGSDGNGSTTPKTFNFNNISSGNIVANLANISKRLHSPSGINNYNSCGANGTNGYYKVVGGGVFATDGSLTGCNNRTKTLDVGHSFSQTLTWNDYGMNNGSKYNNGDKSATAQVKVPYNYMLTPYVDNQTSGKIAYLGEDVTMRPGVVTVPRTNIAFPSDKQNYATITKPTDIEVKYYYRSASGGVISVNGVTENYVTSSSRSAIRLNRDGLIEGTTEQASQKSVDNGGTQLPDVKIAIANSGVSVGDKVCVEVSVFPADSHDNRNAGSVNGAGVAAGLEPALIEGSTLDRNNRANWATAVSCSTIAKKPTMSVESSNAYSATQFKTAKYNRNVDLMKVTFGSWSEYGVFGRVRTDNNSSLFVSGAALGYSRDGYPNAQGVNAPRVNDVASVNNNKIAASSNTNNCTFMTQTFANANCESSNTNIGGVSARIYSERMKDRYSGGAEFNTNGLPVKNYGSAAYVDLSGYNGSDVIAEGSGIVRFRSSKNLYISSLPNLTDAQFASKGVDRRNRTIVYDAPDRRVIIDGNIGVSNGANSTIDGLTQVIIFAKSVYITDNPTYINAVIIAETVNTCKYTGNEAVSVGGKSGASMLSSGRCNQTLRFDAPVVTSKLILNRTAGADNGNYAIRRAEIFNLNMANYLWSFNQMSRLSQATTTYLRELPSRY